MPALTDAAASNPDKWRGKSITITRRAAKKLIRFGRLHSLVRIWIEVEDERARRRPPSQIQPDLPFPSLLLSESDRIRCRLGCVMSVRSCLVRRTRHVPAGGGKYDAKFPECVGCSLGYDFAARCPTFIAPGQHVSGLMSPEQRRARMIADLSTPKITGDVD